MKSWRTFIPFMFFISLFHMCQDEEDYIRLNTDDDYVEILVVAEGEEEGEETIPLIYETGAEIGSATVKPTVVPIDTTSGVQIDVYFDETALSNFEKNSYSLSMVEISIVSEGYEEEDPLSFYLYEDAQDYTHYFITMVPDGEVEEERRDIFTFKVWGIIEE